MFVLLYSRLLRFSAFYSDAVPGKRFIMIMKAFQDQIGILKQISTRCAHPVFVLRKQFVLVRRNLLLNL